MAVAQGVRLAGLLIGGDFLDEVAHAVIGKAGGVQQLEGEIGLLRLPPVRQQLWF